MCSNHDFSPNRDWDMSVTGRGAYAVQVTVADADTWPRWLHYDDKSSLLEGVPAPSDAKQTVTINLLSADSQHYQQVVDQFSIGRNI